MIARRIWVCGYTLARAGAEVILTSDLTLYECSRVLIPQDVRHAIREESFGAGNETRTRDLNLGKVALYQLSYSRPKQRRNCRAVPLGVKEN
jgi:hypothetical protein